MKQDFETTTINEKWVADITYINTLRDGWCYLASVLVLHTKKIIGYSFSTSMTTELVSESVNCVPSVNSTVTLDRREVFSLSPARIGIPSVAANEWPDVETHDLAAIRDDPQTIALDQRRAGNSAMHRREIHCHRRRV